MQRTKSSLEKFTSVSIIIPIYNARKYLNECLNSVKTQSLSNIEIILINDGSSDSSKDIAKKFIKNDCRFKLVENTKTMGVSYSRNIGISIATGEYIAFLDADDFYISPDALGILYAEAKRTGSEIIGGSLYTVDYRSKITNRNISGQYFTRSQKLTYTDYQFDGGFYRFIYSKSFLLNNKIKFPYLKRFQDPIFFVRALETVPFFVVIPDYIYAYRKNHKIYNWDRKSFMDHVSGVFYLIKKSSKKGYPKLHLLMLHNMSRSIAYRSKNLSYIELTFISLKAIRNINIPLLKKEFSFGKILKISLILLSSPIVGCFNRRFL